MIVLTGLPLPTSVLCKGVCKGNWKGWCNGKCKGWCKGKVGNNVFLSSDCACNKPCTGKLAALKRVCGIVRSLLMCGCKFGCRIVCNTPAPGICGKGWWNASGGCNKFLNLAPWGLYRVGM